MMRRTIWGALLLLTGLLCAACSQPTTEPEADATPPSYRPESVQELLSNQDVGVLIFVESYDFAPEFPMSTGPGTSVLVYNGIIVGEGDEAEAMFLSQFQGGAGKTLVLCRVDAGRRVGICLPSNAEIHHGPTFRERLEALGHTVIEVSIPEDLAPGILPVELETGAEVLDPKLEALLAYHEREYGLSRDPAVVEELLERLVNDDHTIDSLSPEELRELHESCEGWVGLRRGIAPDPRAVGKYIQAIYGGDFREEGTPLYRNVTEPYNLWALIRIGPGSVPKLLIMLKDETESELRSDCPKLHFRSCGRCGEVPERQVTYAELADYALRHIYHVDMGYHHDLSEDERQAVIAKWRAHVYPDEITEE